MDDYTYMLEEGLSSEMNNFEMYAPLSTPAHLLGRARDAITKRLGGGYGEVGLLLEVIMRAAKSKDTKYFEHGAFKHHCFLLGCDHEKLGKAILDNISEVRTSKKLTEAEKREIRDKYRSGVYTRKRLAEEHGIPQHSVRAALAVRTTKKPFLRDVGIMTDKKVREVMAELNSGVLLSVVAKKHGVTKYLVYQFLEAVGDGKYILKIKLDK